MAEPAAVPGVDPSQVNTPGELAACLDGLRLRRDLSYEAMENAAARLLSRPGGSRLERLPKSTVGDIVTGKRPPTRGKLLTFLAVCEVAPADLAQWLAAWERAITADLARPAGVVRVRNARPDLLGVHKAISVPGIPDDALPQYVPRDLDAAEFGIRARVRAAAQRGGFVLLVGGSSVGKTRCAFEAVKTLLPEWWLVHPAGPAEVRALAQAPPPRTVVWLDELQCYLDVKRGLTGGTVRALLAGPNPIVIISTLWPDRYAAYTTVPAPGGPDPHAREREMLGLAAVIRIREEFSPAEQDRARAAAARDPRVQVALGAAGYGLTQTLAAAPQLVARWEDARTASPYGWAVLTAALDVARLGARAPLPADLLRAAAPGYCTGVQQAEAPSNWFEQALAYATQKLHGTAAALSPAAAGMGQIAGYAVADYLLQHATRERRSARVPASTWDAIFNDVRDPADTVRLASSAERRLLYSYAIPLYRRAADAGDQNAALKLAVLLADRGDFDGSVQILRVLERAGDKRAAERLCEQLCWRGNLDGAMQILRALPRWGHWKAARRLARALAERGDLDGLRALIDAGYREAVQYLAGLLAERGDLDGLRALIDEGYEEAAWKLNGLLARRGDLDGLRALIDADSARIDADARASVVYLTEHGKLDEVIKSLRTRADAGDMLAAMLLAERLTEHGDLDEALQVLCDRAHAPFERVAGRLADLLARRGDLDGLRALASAGYENAARKLNGLLAERGDLDGLRARADAGDQDAALELARLLADRGDLDGAAQILRPLADAGNLWAPLKLAGLLAERGDLDGLRARADAGDLHAALELAGLLADCGDLDGAAQILRARADAGDLYAALELAGLLAERGDLDGLRARADAGDLHAALELAGLLAERGDLDGLRARADAGDLHAAHKLAELLADRGDLDGAVQILRTLADAGNGNAWWLAELLTRQGRGEEAERLRHFGLNPDGSIACK